MITLEWVSQERDACLGRSDRKNAGSGTGVFEITGFYGEGLEGPFLEEFRIGLVCSIEPGDLLRRRAQSKICAPAFCC